MEAAMNPNSPKIVTDRQGFALYFSRSVIPFVRGKEQTEWLRHFPYLKHLGIYAYRREILQEVTQLPQSPLELAESLEQLRWLENGYRIRVGITDVETVGIDTPEDLQRAEEFLKTIQKLQAWDISYSVKATLFLKRRLTVIGYLPRYLLNPSPGLL